MRRRMNGRTMAGSAQDIRAWRAPLLLVCLTGCLTCCLTCCLTGCGFWDCFLTGPWSDRYQGSGSLVIDGKVQPASTVFGDLSFGTCEPQSFQTERSLVLSVMGAAADGSSSFPTTSMVGLFRTRTPLGIPGVKTLEPENDTLFDYASSLDATTRWRADSPGLAFRGQLFTTAPEYPDEGSLVVERLGAGLLATIDTPDGQRMQFWMGLTLEILYDPEKEP